MGFKPKPLTFVKGIVLHFPRQTEGTDVLGPGSWRSDTLKEGKESCRAPAIPAAKLPVNTTGVRTHISDEAKTGSHQYHEAMCGTYCSFLFFLFKLKNTRGCAASKL